MNRLEEIEKVMLILEEVGSNSEDVLWLIKMVRDAEPFAVQCLVLSDKTGINAQEWIMELRSEE